jgi:cbb3-type cytochrome oxidase maturation protein
MEILIVLVPLSIVLIAIATAMFVWAVDNDQFEQLDLHGFDLLLDDRKDDQKDDPKDDPGDTP